MRPSRTVRSERGETLIELLMTITIAGIALTGLLAGLATAINASGRHRGQADADVVLVSSAESVKKQAYVACPGVSTSSYSPSQGVTLPAGWSTSDVTIVSVQKWNGTAFQASCPTHDQDLQLITVRATTPDGRSSEQVEVIKRDAT